MSIDIEITQKGLFKKTLDYNTIIGDLGYGLYESNRLTEGKIGDDEFIVYDKEHIGRGISVVCKKGEKEKVSLRMLSPTCEEEIDVLYDIVERIASAWKGCLVMQDEEKIDPHDLTDLRTQMKEFNKGFLKTLLEKESEPDSVLAIFSAMWQLDLGEKDKAELLAASDSIKAYGEWLHRLQEIDAYYAVPSFYSTENDEILGMYFITEDTVSIIPIKPSVPFGFNDPQTGKPIEVSQWLVSFYSITNDNVAGRLPYEKFTEYVLPKSKRYDGSRIIIDGIKQEEMDDILKIN